KAESATTGSAAHRHQDSIKYGFFFGYFLAFQRRLNAVAFLGHLDDLGAEEDLVKDVFQSIVQGPHQVAINAGEQAIGELDDRYLAAQGGVNIAQLQTDVTTSNHQKRPRYFCQPQCA